jgi:hypothetical protein
MRMNFVFQLLVSQPLSIYMKHPQTWLLWLEFLMCFLNFLYFWRDGFSRFSGL